MPGFRQQQRAGQIAGIVRRSGKITFTQRQQLLIEHQRQDPGIGKSAIAHANDQHDRTGQRQQKGLPFRPGCKNVHPHPSIIILK
ncbi:hypothetical protein [Klebsiella michiganensis]|uniref:hypothetical protein n=1 Tax=Klebsiella michiganensis TaxID=1134687 RepID=UPI001D172CC2|nr:hypothetical protein [Klebsiella michiganensis]